jgi:hypothetical protein
MFKADVPDMIHYENVRDGLALESRVIWAVQKHAEDQAELPLKAVGAVRDCANPLASLSAPCKKQKSRRPIPVGRKLRMRTRASILGFAASTRSLGTRKLRRHRRGWIGGGCGGEWPKPNVQEIVYC